MAKPKIILAGHARHGKDTVAELLHISAGYSFQSSSMTACEAVIFPILKYRYGYANALQCFNDRVNHRKEWFDLIVAYNTPDRTKLAQVIFDKSDIYVGLRNIHELKSIKAAGLVDIVVWVTALNRLPPESGDSCTITSEDCDYLLDNNGDFVALTKEVYSLIEYLE